MSPFLCSVTPSSTETTFRSAKLVNTGPLRLGTWTQWNAARPCALALHDQWVSLDAPLMNTTFLDESSMPPG
jgi:hypothetical protein